MRVVVVLSLISMPQNLKYPDLRLKLFTLPSDLQSVHTFHPAPTFVDFNIIDPTSLVVVS